MFNALIGMFASFGIALASEALLGVGCQGGFSYHMFPAFYHGWISAQFGCLVVQGITHLGCFLALTSQPYPIWTFSWGLHYFLEGTFVSQCLRRFWRGFQSCYQTFPIFLTWDGLSILSNIPGGVRSCHRVFYHLTTRLVALLFGAWLSQSSPFSWGFSKFIGKTDPWLR